jgi:predicted DNA-binding helix-hairpin-helix protein
VRFYGFRAQELTTPGYREPRFGDRSETSWGPLRNRQLFPIDLNEAPRELLLRVPGLGTKSDSKTCAASLHKVRLADLPRLHVSVKKLLPFVITADYNSAALAVDRSDLDKRFTAPERQLDLFSTEPSVLTGQL